MRKSIGALINEMKSKMSGYAVMLQYRYMNLVRASKRLIRSLR